MREIKMLLAGGLAHREAPAAAGPAGVRVPVDLAPRRRQGDSADAEAPRPAQRAATSRTSSKLGGLLAILPASSFTNARNGQTKIVAPRLRVLQRRRGGLFRLRGPVDGSAELFERGKLRDILVCPREPSYGSKRKMSSGAVPCTRCPLT